METSARAVSERVRPAAAVGGRPLARRGFQFLAWLFAAGVLAQTFLAGLSLFVDGRRWLLHIWVGTLLAVPALAMLIVAAVGRLTRRTRRLTVVAFVLLMVQGATASMGGLAGAIHPANALVLFWVSTLLVGGSRIES